MVPLLLALVAANVAFYHWMRQPTREGRKVMDRIDGLEMYLTTAEADELSLAALAPVTPERFESLLPYAIALGVENRWAERLEESLARVGQTPESAAS